jgi:plasmid stabilization system protein ParE
MARRVVWTEAASSDLAGAADYIARDSRFYAAAFVREVRAAARSLRLSPERGRVVPELRQPEIRQLLVQSYRLVYSVAPKQVHVLALIHGARDFTKAWGEHDLFL